MSEQTADSFQVSPQQEQLWLSEPEGPSARLQAVLAIDGALDRGSLEAALTRAVRRHESLRTTFVHQPGIKIPLQVVNERLDPAWATLDLDTPNAAERESNLKQLRLDELEQPLELETGPLVRALLVRGGENQHTLILTVSALCADSASLTVLVRELAGDLGAAVGELVEDPLQYADFSAWQRELQDSEEDEARAAVDFWADVDEAAGPALPFTDAGRGSPAGEVAVALDADLAAAIASQAERYGASASAFVQTAWQVLLGRSSGAEAVVVGYLGSERRHPDLDGAVGAFSRPVPVRARVDAEVTFAEVLSEVAQARENALVWQDYAPAGADDRLTAGFVEYEFYEGQAADVRFSLECVAGSGQPFQLWLTCAERRGADRGIAIDLRIGSSPGGFNAETAERLARRLELLLGAAADDPGAAVEALPLLDEQERAELLRAFNDTAAPIPDACVHALIAAHAAASPSRAAVIDEHGSITYAELGARANQLAHRLQRAGVGADVAVGLCTDRSVEMVVGLLGIMKAGGAYVPLHYEHPTARLQHQLTTAGARALVTQESLVGLLEDFPGEVVCLDRDREQLDTEPSSAPDVEVSHQQLAYVTYTSGSTGAPKGVGVTHGNLASYATAIARQLGADSESLAFGVVTSISTDLGNTSLYGALCSGGTLVLVSPVAAADPAALSAQFQATPIDVLKITPSHAAALLAGGDRAVLPKRWLVIGGERAPWDLVRRVQELSGCGILNHYGPTETTIGCCTFAVAKGPGRWGPATVPIGRPIANASCYVLDERQQLVPLGAPGRLYVGGAGVARGYVGAPELTAERFLPDPFATAAGARMYDTGDLARWLPDGTLEFLGRADEQVKIRGYRVEPAEVETALRSHDAVRDAVVVSWDSSAGEHRLAAYCAVDGAVGQDELRSHLADWLPDFMIPAAIATLDELPRTPSGKVDRLALPDPETLGEANAEYVAARTPMEEAVTAIWSQVLGVERVGVQDDFFTLGGHSLLATQVVAQVRSDFAVELPLHSLFTYPTVASLTEEIVRMMGDSDEDETARLVAELEDLSDEEAERLLAGELPPPESRQA